MNHIHFEADENKQQGEQKKDRKTAQVREMQLSFLSKDWDREESERLDLRMEKAALHVLFMPVAIWYQTQERHAALISVRLEAT